MACIYKIEELMLKGRRCIVNGELMFNGDSCYYIFDNESIVLEVFCLNIEVDDILGEKVESTSGLSYSSTKEDGE